MAYVKNSKVKRVSKSKVKDFKKFKFSDAMKLRLKKHRARHIKAGNIRDKVNKHMTLMRGLMRQGASFNLAHKEAQKKYPMA